MKTLMNTWCTSARGHFGISVVENEFGEVTMRGANVGGKHEPTDLKTIEDWGGLVSICDLEKMIKLVREKRKNKNDRKNR